jgi:hypothetical protein
MYKAGEMVGAVVTFLDISDRNSLRFLQGFAVDKSAPTFAA